MTPETLSIHDAVGILPSIFSPVKFIKNRQQFVSTSHEIAEFHETKEYTVANTHILCTASKTLEKYDVKWIMRSLGLDGIIMMPSEIILDYAKNDRVSTLKNGCQILVSRRLAL